MIALEADPAVVVLAEADVAGRFGPVVSDFPPDVICLDLSVPSGDAVDAMTSLSVRLPKARVLLLIGPEDDPGPGLLAGAAGSIEKNAALDHGLAAVYRIAGGGTHLDARGAAAILEVADSLDRLGRLGLSSRDRELLTQLSVGRTADELEPFFGRSSGELDRTLSELLSAVRDAWSGFVTDETSDILVARAIGHTLHQSTASTAVDSATR